MVQSCARGRTVDMFGRIWYTVSRKGQGGKTMKRKLRKSAALTALAAVLLAGGAALPRAAAAEPDTRIPILTYHDLTRDPENTDSMTITDERFRLDMEFLQEFGYTPLCQRTCCDPAGEYGDAGQAVMVTFDERYQSNYARLPDSAADRNEGGHLCSRI